MLGAGMLSSAKKRRAKLSWYYTVGTEQRKNFERDPMNNGRKMAVVSSIVKSIEQKGVVADARGRMWLIDKPDPESTLISML